VTSFFILLMLSIAAIGRTGAALRYYSRLGEESRYYLKEEAATPTWWGRGAEALGLLGRKVEERELGNLLRGLAPDGSRALVQLQRGHQPGWDLTFSACKSASALYALTTGARQRDIERAHQGAVGDALAFVEGNLFTRRGKGGRQLEGCGLVAALIQHDGSRAGDPSLHTHCLALNLALRSDATFGALRGRDLYGPLKMAAGSVYRASLAEKLRTLGLELVPGKHSFEIRGLPKALLRELSSRRVAIEADLARRGERGARAAERAALRTRGPKDPRQDPFERARTLAASHGFGATQVEALFRSRTPSRELSTAELRRALEIAALRLANDKSSFTRADLICETARKIEHRGPHLPALFTAIDSFLADPKRALPAPPRRPGEPRFAPPWLLRAEAELVSLATRSRGNASHVLRLRSVKAALDANPALSPEQREALRHVLRSAGSIQCVEGLPGSGKSTLLRVARAAWERAGFRVVGCCLSSRAARELESASGICSDTLARTLRRLEPSLGAALSHHARQLGRAAAGKRTWPMDSLRLTPKHVVVLDEASMVGTLELTRLCQAARTGSKLVVVGDSCQLQAVAAPGGGFAALHTALGAARLDLIHRQQRGWMRDAVHQVRAGDVRSALALYAARGRVAVERSTDAARARLISDWQKLRTLELKETLILAGTREDARALNLAAQEARRREGALGAAVSVGEGTLRERDRVVFSANHRGLGVANGELGTLEHIHAVIPSGFARVTVRLDRMDARGKPIRVSFWPRSFSALEPGYCITAHRAQGCTVRRSFILAGGWIQDRELALVQLSRHSEDARIYVSARDAGPDLHVLANAMAQSRKKELAIAPALEPRPHLEQERV